MNVLIAGGSGLIGKRLSEILVSKGHNTALLSRSKSKGSASFMWDPSQGTIDQSSIKWADAVVNLAGAGVADERWTPSRKVEIERSRVDATNLLVKAIATSGGIQSFISASAIGIYGSRRKDELLQENSNLGSDFLSEVCQSWEQAALPSKNFTRLAIVRIGIVLSVRGGALDKLLGPARLGLLSPIGTGKQWMSWIHIDDLCEAFVFLLEQGTLQGVFNGTAPSPETNSSFTRILAKTLDKKVWLPSVPEFAMKLIMGEMSEVVVGGQRVLPNEFLHAGFQYKYPQLEQALKNLISKNN